MMHYWNPTHYNNRNDLVIPLELADPELYPHELDEVDELHLIVQGSYPFEINTRRRWHSDVSHYDKNRDKFRDSFYVFKA